jgi:hypothetical protein
VMFDYPAWNSKSFDAVTNAYLSSSCISCRATRPTLTRDHE